MSEGERMKLVRKAKGLTMEKFGKQIGMGSSSISDIENGRRSLTKQTFLSVCREFDVNEHWLHTGEGDMFIQKSRSDEISAFFGDILHDDTSFRQKFISVLARMTTEEWALLEKKVLELAEEIKKADP